MPYETALLQYLHNLVAGAQAATEKFLLILITAPYADVTNLRDRCVVQTCTGDRIQWRWQIIRFTKNIIHHVVRVS